MKFKYAGPLDVVDVPVLGLVGVKRGDVVEATGEIAKSLESQRDAWQKVADPKPRKKAAAKKVADPKLPATPPGDNKTEE
jgi:hypothetical protein